MPVFSRLLPTLTSAYALQSRERSIILIDLIKPLNSDLLQIPSVFALVFVPQQNDKYYDLGGALGFLSTTFISLYYPALKAKFYHGIPGPLPALSTFAPRQLLLTAALGIWSIRLGSFLAYVGLPALHIRNILKDYHPACNQSGRGL